MLLGRSPGRGKCFARSKMWIVIMVEARRDAPHSVLAKFNRNVEFNMATPLKARGKYVVVRGGLWGHRDATRVPICNLPLASFISRFLCRV